MEVPEYDRAMFTTSGRILAASYGTMGSIKVNEETTMEVIVLLDDTKINGYYVKSLQNDNSYETTIYKYGNIFILFKVQFSTEDTNDDINNHTDQLEVRKRMINYITNII